MQRDAETTQSAKHAYSRVPDLSLQMVGSPPHNRHHPLNNTNFVYRTLDPRVLDNSARVLGGDVADRIMCE